MQPVDIMREFTEAEAVLHGHFILTSGLHTDTYIQCARVLMDAARAGRLCRQLAQKLRQWMKEHNQVIDIIVAPAMGGVVVGYEMGRQLDVLSLFCERVDGQFTLRRGFTLEPGQRVLIVEDVVTTGKSSMETARCIEDYGATPVAVTSLIDRRADNDVALTLPLISLLQVQAATFAADNVPPTLAGIPAVKPGSRFLQQKPA